MTVLKKLSATPQADNTAISAANSDFSSWPAPGTGASGVHLTAARMGAPAGYAFNQTSTGTVFGYLDLDTSIPDMHILWEFKYASTPTASSTTLRGYGNTTHATTLWSISFTTANRMQFFEVGTGGLNTTSSSVTPMVPGSEYVATVNVNNSTNSMTTVVYPRGSTTPLFTITGSLSADAAASNYQSVRLGIGTASSLSQMYVNSNFSIGDSAITRTDVPSNTAPLAGEDQTVDSYTTVYLSATDAESSVTWTQTGGSPTVVLNGSGNDRSFEAPALINGTTLTFTATDTGGLSDSCVVTVYPHSEFFATTGGLEPIKWVQVPDIEYIPSLLGVSPLGTSPLGT